MKFKYSDIIKNQPTLNLGMIGHVASGKSTLTRQITGIKTQKFSSELVENWARDTSTKSRGALGKRFSFLGSLPSHSKFILIHFKDLQMPSIYTSHHSWNVESHIYTPSSSKNFRRTLFLHSPLRNLEPRTQTHNSTHTNTDPQTFLKPFKAIHISSLFSSQEYNTIRCVK